MKLLTVLMLIALPVSCFAGPGCTLLEEVIDDTISSEVDIEQYVKTYQEFIPNEPTANSLKEMKQCFLDQSDGTLENVRLMMDSIYTSEQCAEY